MVFPLNLRTENLCIFLTWKTFEKLRKNRVKKESLIFPFGWVTVISKLKNLAIQQFSNSAISKFSNQQFYRTRKFSKIATLLRTNYVNCTCKVVNSFQQFSNSAFSNSAIQQFQNSAIQQFYRTRFIIHNLYVEKNTLQSA